MSQDTTRIVLYSHDALGLGHLRRNLALAHQLAHDLPRLTGAGVTGLLVAGLAPPADFPLPPGFDWLILPGFTKGPVGYRPRRLRDTPQSLAALRSDLVATALIGFAPALVIVDRHLYGVRGELRAPLHRLREARPATRIVLGLREVLDDPETASAEWEALDSPDALRRIIDEVWVYGDRRVHDPLASGEIPDFLHDLAVFTGYLADGRALLDRERCRDETPFVLTTVGGGSDGARLLKTAAALTPPPGYRHVLVTGPQLGEADAAAVRAAAAPGTEIHRCPPGLSRYIERACAVVTMGGYNTVCEVLASSAPALIVPREEPRREQLIRARALQGAGAVDVMREADLDVGALTRWVARAVTRRVLRARLRRDGLRTAAARAAALLRPDPTISRRARQERAS